MFVVSGSPMSTLGPVHLRTFLAVGKHLSYTPAAEEVYLSRPAVSRQVQRREHDLGVSIFEQIGKSLHLSDAGRTLTQRAQDLLARVDRVAESVAEHQTAGAGGFRADAGTTPEFYLLPSLLGRFHRLHSGVELRYTVEPSQSVERKALRGEMDLGFIGHPPVMENITAEPIAEDEIVPDRPAICRRQAASASESLGIMFSLTRGDPMECCLRMRDRPQAGFALDPRCRPRLERPQNCAPGNHRSYSTKVRTS